MKRQYNASIRRLFLINSLAILLSSAALFSSSTVAQQSPVKPVQVDQVEKSVFVPTVDIVGSIFSRNNVQLTAGVGGRLDFAAEPGTFLLKGDEVARIDALPLQLQKAEQEAEIKRAIINQKYLKREVTRLQDLRKTNSASAFELDQTQSQYELANADLEIARLRLKQINDQLSRTLVKAPFDGVVTERVREAGSDVSRSDLLVRMLDTENLEGRIFVPVKYLPYLRTSKEVVIRSDSNQNNDFKQVNARIKAIIPAADQQSQSFELRVSLPPGASETWTSGELITATVPVLAPQEALTVHRDALILRKEGTYIVVIDDQNTARRHLVEVGRGMKERVTIQSDAIKAGDRVATRGAERVQEGQKVSIAG